MKQFTLIIFLILGSVMINKNYNESSLIQKKIKTPSKSDAKWDEDFKKANCLWNIDEKLYDSKFCSTYLKSIDLRDIEAERITKKFEKENH